MSDKKKAQQIARTKASQTALNRFMTSNASLLRSELIQTLLDPRRDIDTECGYPTLITMDFYNKLYSREGVAKRVVRCLPEESWSLQPEIYETEDDEETEFEKAFNLLKDKKSIFQMLQRVDELSGIGRFGILLLGLDDGLELSEPVVKKDCKLIFLRAFDESVVSVTTLESDPSNPRFGMPTKYQVSFEDQTGGNQMLGTTVVPSGQSISKEVHWSRVIHIADNRRMSEIFGSPRMEPVYNRLLDIRKILSGSGEMFWRGAFPGYSFEVNPDQKDVTLDATAMREEFNNYSQGLQRYLALEGVTAKSLAPQVADPKGHLEAQLDYIAITLGIPKRVLFGSEQAQLASSQDSDTWSRRLGRRQNDYLTSLVIRPFIDRLVEYGVLPTTKETDEDGAPVYTVEWPNLFNLSEEEQARIADSQTKALATYVSGNVETLIPPMQFLTLIMHMTDKEAEAIIKEAEAHEVEMQADEEAHQEELDAEIQKQGLVPAVPPPGTPPGTPPQKPVPGQLQVPAAKVPAKPFGEEQ